MVKIDASRLAPLFSDYQNAMICACLEGRTGAAFADSPTEPTVGILEIASFVYVAGNPRSSAASGLFTGLFDAVGRGCLHFSFVDAEWERVFLDALADDATFEKRRYVRREMRRDISAFDTGRLRLLARAPEGYEIVEMGEELFLQSKQPGWRGGLAGAYDTYAEFGARAAGYAALSNGAVVGAATVYADSREFAEIDIGIAEAHRRRGLAAACCARLMLNLISRGICPDWDAANDASIKLASVLGYTVEREFPCYFVRRSISAGAEG